MNKNIGINVITVTIGSFLCASMLIASESPFTKQATETTEELAITIENYTGYPLTIRSDDKSEHPVSSAWAWPTDLATEGERDPYSQQSFGRVTLPIASLIMKICIDTLFHYITLKKRDVRALKDSGVKTLCLRHTYNPFEAGSKMGPPTSYQLDGWGIKPDKVLEKVWQKRVKPTLENNS